MTREEILSFLRENREHLEEKYGVLKIGLFGSYARNEAAEDSDVDIAVELKRENISERYFALLHFLEDTLRKKIDLGIASNIRPEIKKHFDRDIIYV